MLVLCIPVPLPQSIGVFCEHLCTRYYKVHAVPLSLCQYSPCCIPSGPCLTAPILQYSFHLCTDSILGLSSLLQNLVQEEGAA